MPITVPVVRHMSLRWGWRDHRFGPERGLIDLGFGGVVGWGTLALVGIVVVVVGMVVGRWWLMIVNVVIV